MGRISDTINFGAYHIGWTAVGAGVGAICGSIVSGGAGPGALVGGASQFISYPVDRFIERVGRNDDNTSKNWVDTAQFVNQTITSGVIWGGLALLGAISLPVAGVGFATFGAYRLVSTLESVLKRVDGVEEDAISFMAFTLKTAIVVGSIIGLISLGVISPAAGILMGAAFVAGYCLIKALELAEEEATKVRTT